MINIDYFIFQKINQYAGVWPVLDFIGVFLARFLFYFVILYLIVLLFKNWKNWAMVIKALLAAVIARFGVTELIRHFFPRPRPFMEYDVNLLLKHPNENSFPSGHASFLFALSFVIYSYNKKMGLIFFAASALISLARVFVGIHWPSDILAGALVGIFSGWFVTKILKK